jgi:Ca2+-binding EF-hand superfamily protein
MKRISLIALLSIALMLPALPVLAQNEQDQTVINPFIKRFDRNQDGLISADEFPGLAECFERLDLNNDGFIDASEAPQGRFHRRHVRHFDRSQYDLDGDGRISLEEFLSAAQTRFERMDRNADGYIDAAEWGSKRMGRPGRR